MYSRSPVNLHLRAVPVWCPAAGVQALKTELMLMSLEDVDFGDRVFVVVLPALKY
jgi:hypothetical protein